MAGRFITIKYQEGKVDDANKFFSSVFYSNLILSILVVLILFFFLINLEVFFTIPPGLIIDVKLLFFFSIITTIISLLTNVYGVATFIKNRLELSSVRQIIGNIIRLILIIFLFVFFPAHLWYYGVTGVIMTLYLSFTNYKFCCYLTPELYLSRRNFDWTKVIELLKSGMWNVINRLGTIMGQGFDMVIANVCISATAMGLFSISKSIPVLILSFFGMLSGVFAPLFTQLYAQHKHKELKAEFSKSIRICGFFANIPLTCLFVYGDCFYKLWLPGEDSQKLQLLTIVGSLELILSMPLEPLWNIFTITNRLKYSTLVLISVNILIFSTLLFSMTFVSSPFYRLIFLVGASSFWNSLKNLFFLPLYGAHCMNFARTFFYRPLLMSVVSFCICCIAGKIFRLFFTIESWGDILSISVIIFIICTMINSIFMLKQTDRQFIIQKILRLK